MFKAPNLYFFLVVWTLIFYFIISKNARTHLFRDGDFSLKNAQRSGRPVKVHETHIKDIRYSDCHSTTREIADNLNVSHTCKNKKKKKK